MCPAKKVDVIDTTGAGDAFFAGTVIGLTYGKGHGGFLRNWQRGWRRRSSAPPENVCPRFRPQEFGLDVEVVD